jgi:hypothetical protein
MAAAQRVGSVGEQLDVRKTAAERDEVPRAVDIRQVLEQAHDAPREQHREREKCRGSPQCAPVGLEQRRGQERQRNGHDCADGPAAARVQHLVDQPGMAANPLRAGGIEEHRARDVLVERRVAKDDRRHDEDRERDLQLGPPETRALRAVQNDRRVSMRSCMLSMSLLRSSGKARSMWSTLPSPERALPRRSPSPTSLSQPTGAAA